MKLNAIFLLLFLYGMSSNSLADYKGLIFLGFKEGRWEKHMMVIKSVGAKKEYLLEQDYNVVLYTQEASSMAVKPLAFSGISAPRRVTTNNKGWLSLFESARDGISTTIRDAYKETLRKSGWSIPESPAITVRMPVNDPFFHYFLEEEVTLEFSGIEQNYRGVENYVAAHFTDNTEGQNEKQLNGVSVVFERHGGALLVRAIFITINTGSDYSYRTPKYRAQFPDGRGGDGAGAAGASASGTTVWANFVWERLQALNPADFLRSSLKKPSENRANWFWFQSHLLIK